jgi:hypothetical protein
VRSALQQCEPDLVVSDQLIATKINEILQ